MNLTRREKEVLRLILTGLSSSVAAEEMGVCKRTIDFHLQNIYAKLDVTNRVQAFLKVQKLQIEL